MAVFGMVMIVERGDLQVQIVSIGFQKLKTIVNEMHAKKKLCVILAGVYLLFGSAS